MQAAVDRDCQTGLPDGTARRNLMVDDRMYIQVMYGCNDDVWMYVRGDPRFSWDLGFGASTGSQGSESNDCLFDTTLTDC